MMWEGKFLFPWDISNETEKWFKCIKLKMTVLRTAFWAKCMRLIETFFLKHWGSQDPLIINVRLVIKFSRSWSSHCSAFTLMLLSNLTYTYTDTYTWVLWTHTAFWIHPVVRVTRRTIPRKLYWYEIGFFRLQTMMLAGYKHWKTCHVWFGSSEKKKYTKTKLIADLISTDNPEMRDQNLETVYLKQIVANVEKRKEFEGESGSTSFSLVNSGFKKCSLTTHLEQILKTGFMHVCYYQQVVYMSGLVIVSCHSVLQLEVVMLQLYFRFCCTWTTDSHQFLRWKY